MAKKFLISKIRGKDIYKFYENSEAREYVGMIEGDSKIQILPKYNRIEVLRELKKYIEEVKAVNFNQK